MLLGKTNANYYNPKTHKIDFKKLLHHSVYEENQINLDDDDFSDSSSESSGNEKHFYMSFDTDSDYDSEIGTSANDESMKHAQKSRESSNIVPLTQCYFEEGK